MSRLLKVDFYKMFRSKSFYIIGAVFVAMTTFVTLVLCFSMLSSYNQLLENPSFFGIEGAEDAAISFGPSNVFSSISSSISSPLTYVSIFSILFMCSEFSQGTIKNIASKGFRRESIYFSKYICGIVCAVIYAAVVVIVNLLCATFVIGDKIPNYFNMPSQFFVSVSLSLMLMFSYLAFVLMIASIVRSSGASIGVFFIVNVLFYPIIIPKIDNFFKDVVHIDFSLSKYTLSYWSNQTSFMDLSVPLASDNLTRIICVAVGFFIVFSGIGVYLFRKRDI